MLFKRLTMFLFILLIKVFPTTMPLSGKVSKAVT